MLGKYININVKIILILMINIIGFFINCLGFSL